jgi:hypothetical protein
MIKTLKYKHRKLYRLEALHHVYLISPSWCMLVTINFWNKVSIFSSQDFCFFRFDLVAYTVVEACAELLRLWTTTVAGGDFVVEARVIAGY